jgi:hypothetical protein
MCMINNFKLRCRMDIEQTIEVPLTGFFIKNESSARICYKIDDTLKYLYYPTPIDVAQLLKKRGMIHIYSIKGDAIKMFESVLITITGDKGQPIQQQRLVELKWNDIELNPAQVQTIAAEYELEKNGVVKDFIKKVFKAAS